MSEILTRERLLTIAAQQTDTSTWDRIGRHDAALREELARLTKLIEEAPHEEGCPRLVKRTYSITGLNHCDCWKKVARP